MDENCSGQEAKKFAATPTRGPTGDSQATACSKIRGRCAPIRADISAREWPRANTTAGCRCNFPMPECGNLRGEDGARGAGSTGAVQGTQHQHVGAQQPAEDCTTLGKTVGRRLTARDRQWVKINRARSKAYRGDAQALADASGCGY